jgi:hypothetical protein
MDNLTNKVSDLIKAFISLKKYQDKVDDLSAYQLIQNIVKLPGYFPVTDSSIGFHTLLTILNDIILNKRQNIIEFGSGISTLVIAKLIKEDKLGCKFYSVEDNPDWISFMKDNISKNGLEEYVLLIYAPLEKTNLAVENNSWYSVKALEEHIPSDVKIDLALIDGPGAWRPEIKLSRYTAVPFLINKLADNFSVYLDDANRKGEQKIINFWKKKYNLDFNKINSKSSVCIKGNKLNTIL